MIRFTLGFVLLIGMLLGLSAPALAQTGGDPAPKDTLALSKKYWLRQKLYEDNSEAFAPPRKDKWSVGLQVGPSLISGDVRPEGGMGIGLNVRKSLSYVVSLRGHVSTGYAKGLDWRPSGGFLNNEALNGFNNPQIDYTTVGYPFVFYNYRMQYYDAALHGVINLGNISFTRKDPTAAVYFFGGPGLMLYNTKIDAANSSNNEYDYSGIPTDETPDVKQDVLNGVRNILDGEYESQAEFYSYKPSLGIRTFLPTFQFGAGISIKLSAVVDVSLEHRITWSGDDLMDGQRWEETLTVSANSDYLHNTTLGINFRIGKDRVDSKWWANPLKQPLGDIRDLKRLTDREVSDSDNDGIVDANDLEPGTPEGVMVDIRGRALDSDGDGIKDFRDKEPFTPKGALVDPGGMAIDTDRDGVIDLYDQEPNTPAGAPVDPKGIEIKGLRVTGGGGTGLTNPLPMIHFDLGKEEVKQEFYPDLLRVARYMKANPQIKILIEGHTDVRGTGGSNYALSEKRSQNIKDILVKTFGIDESRLSIDGKGSDDLLIEDLPGVYNADREKLHYLNRRVEFIIVQ